MAICMSKTIKQERLRWVSPIVNKEIKLSKAVKVCPYSQRSLERWVALYKRGGEEALEPKSTRPKTSPQETAIWLKEKIIGLRQERSLCALKLRWQLEDEGVLIHERTIGKILKVEGLLRRYRVRRTKYVYVKALRQPGELVEIDIKYVPGRVQNKRYYQYTAIDTASRWRYLAVYDEQSIAHSLLFLAEVQQRFPHPIKAVKTDNGIVFTNWGVGANKRSDRTIKRLHPLDLYCARHQIIHYLIDPGKPAQNGMVERSHRSDQESFYNHHKFKNFSILQKRLRLWNIEYNNLRHCGLKGLSPNQFLTEYQLTNPPNVCA